MKYSLIVYLDNKSQTVKGFSKIDGFKHLDESKLKDIVSFTNEFNNEQELISYLIEEELIPKDYFNGTLGIKYQKSKNDEGKILQYEVSFKEDKKFFDTIFLQYYFKQNLNNKEFMKAFIEKYYTYLKDVAVFSNELRNINYSYKCLVNNNYIPDGTKDMMGSFITHYCRKKSKEGYYKADFTKIRDLAMFAINYEREYIREPIERPNRSSEDIKLEIEHYATLLQNSILIEEYEAYQQRLTKLEEELTFTEANTRRRTNDTTKH